MGISFNGYGTWVPPKITEMTVIATRDYIEVNVPDLVEGVTANYYGTAYSKNIFIRHGEFENDDDGWEQIKGNTYYFNRSKDKDWYPEADEVAKYEVKAYYRDEEAKVDGEISEIFHPDVTNYGTWLIRKPGVNLRVSDRTISLILSQPVSATPITQYGNIKYRISIKKYEHTRVFLYAKYNKETQQADTSKFFTDEDCQIKYGKTIEVPYYVISTEKYVYNDEQTSEIKSVIFELQKIIFKISGNYYVDANGTESYELGESEDVIDITSSMDKDARINRFLVIESDTVWYKPAVTEDPYASELNYKAENQDIEYVVSDNTYIQTVPLSGQSINNMYDTMYRFRVRPFNEAYVGDDDLCTEQSAIATCTNIRDIVKANADYKSLYVEQLSAISANLGVITQGAFGDKQKNHIAMSTFKDDNNTQWYEGETRLGGSDQYFQISVKRDSDGNIVHDSEGNISYEISLKAGDIQLTSGDSELGDGTTFYDSSRKNRLKVTSTGLYFQKNEGTGGIEKWVTVSKVTIDNQRNLVITNDNESLSEKGIKVSGIKAYHFKPSKKNVGGVITMTDPTKDEDNEDPLELKLNASLIGAEPYLTGNDTDDSYKGEIETTISKGQIVLISNADKIEIGNSLIDLSSGSLTKTVPGLASTSWGLTATQLTSVFKGV